MTQQHTQGPWGFNEVEAEIFRADGSVEPLIATVNVDNTSDVQVRADGRLIAAAPDLLAELVKMRKRFYAALVSTGTDPEFASAAVAEADLAIKRATEG